MKQCAAALLAFILVANSHAQNPAGASSEQAPITDSKEQRAAQEKRDQKPRGQVKAAGGDIVRTPEGGAIGGDKAAGAGDKRAATRDDRRRNKDGSIKRRSTQGGTPK